MDRKLIGSLELTKTTTGKPVVNLYDSDTRLQYPVLRLFDVSALLTVGVDPAGLQPGERHHARFFAYYTESQNTNRHGSPYLDVTHLEPIDTPATAASVDTSQLLGELRAIKALLLQALGQEEEPAPPAALVYQDGRPVNPNNAAEVQAFHAYQSAHDHQIPADIESLRRWIQDTPNG